MGQPWGRFLWQEIIKNKIFRQIPTEAKKPIPLHLFATSIGRTSHMDRLAGSNRLHETFFGP